MKKVFAALAALAMMAAVVSCEYDSPDIRFQQTTNLTNDYSALVNALLDQTKTVEEKLNLLEKAINNQTFTLEQKIELLTKAYESGVIKYEELIGKTIAAINSMSTSVAEKLAAIENALKTQTSDLSAKLALIESSVKLGLADNAKAIDLVRTAIGSLQGSLEEKLAAVEKAVKDQTMDLSAKLALIEGAVNSGLVGEDSTLGLVRKAIEALNATAGTANDKLDAIEDAIGSGLSGLTTKMEAIREALAKGLINITEKQDLILTALNSASTYYFTKDELLEVGDDYLYVDAAFWNANHENYEVVRALKDLIPLSLPHKYKFWWKQASGRYPLSGSETTSFYGPLYTEGGMLNSIIDWDGVILAVYIGQHYVNPDPVHIDRNGHSCYYIKKVHKNCSYCFWVKIGERAAGKNLKVQDMIGADSFRKIRRPDGDYIEYVHKSTAIKSTSGVWGFRGLKYYPSQYPDNSVEFIIVEDN